MITNSDLFCEIKKNYEKNYLKNRKKITNKNLTNIQNKLFDKFLQKILISIDLKIDLKTYSAISGAYIYYFISIFTYYYHFNLNIKITSKKNFNFEIKHNFNYFSQVTQNKNFILYILSFINENNGKLPKQKFYNSNTTYKSNIIEINTKKEVTQKKNIEVFFHDLRHLNKLKQLDNKINIYQKKDFNKIKLNIEDVNFNLRNKLIENFKPISSFEKTFLSFFFNFFSTLYFESIKNNLIELNDQIKFFPKIIFTDAHGWFMNDKFRYYLGLQINRGSEIIDFQINGATSLTDHNPHIKVAELFCDEFALWTNINPGTKKKFICLPSLYFVDSQISKTINNDKFEILYFGCGISKYFVGFWSSYISGGFIKKYLNHSYDFLSNINKKNLKLLKFRIRIGNYFFISNDSDNKIVKKFFKKMKYILFDNLFINFFKNFIDKNHHTSVDDYKDLIDEDRKKFFQTINYDPILINEVGINRMKKANILIIDHPSTPVFEALSLNKPTILFWDKSLNIHNQCLSHIFKKLIKNKILFFSPKDAAKQLNKYMNNEHSIDTMWFSDKNIQNLITEIRFLLLNYKNTSNKMSIINQWNRYIKKKLSS